MSQKPPETNQTKSRIQTFYEGKVILLTGGTGFLGKTLIEKLLRSCPSVKRIYLLMREKNGLSVEDRLKKLLDDVVFERLKIENPEFAEKLLAVHGDLHKPKLGLGPDYMSLLVETVDIVVHSAATLRFDEKLSIAITTNVVATKQLCLLAQEMCNLKALVYISTAFSNCDSTTIQETVCPPTLCPDTLIFLSEYLDEKILNSMTPHLIGLKPNTYVYTKCAAEDIINSFRKTLPVAILRPSIVISSLSEPLPGWINKIQGPTGVVISAYSGILHTVMCDDSAVANMVPVDYVANAILALAYSIATQQWFRNCPESKDSTPVINFVSPKTNSITWNQFGDIMEKYVKLYPSLNLMWYPFVLRTRTPWIMAINSILLHYLPAIAIDSISTVCGRPTRFQRLYHQLSKYTQVLKYFSCRHFQFQEDNHRLLWEGLDQQDRLKFPFNMAEMSWEHLMSVYIQGCRQHLLREHPSTLVKARQRLRMLYIIHMVTKWAVVLVSARFIWFTFKQIGRQVMNSTVFIVIG